MIFLGACFPAISRLWVAQNEKIGRSIGNVYIAGIIGSFIGSLGIAYFLMPTFGLKTAIIWQLALLSIVGFVGFIRTSSLIEILKFSENRKFLQ